MAYQWGVMERVFWVRWRKLTAHDLDQILVDVMNTRRSIGDKVIYVSTVPADHPVPTSQERAALDRFAGNVIDHCHDVYLVMEGDGLKHAMQRAAMTTVMVTLRGKRWANLHIHKSVAQALSHIQIKHGLEPTPVLDAARAKGLV